MGSGAQGETAPLLGASIEASGREQEREKEKCPDPLWEIELHQEFCSALRAIDKKAKGDAKWAALSAQLARTGVDRSPETCRAYFKQVKRHLKSKQPDGGEDRRSRSNRKWTQVKREIRSELPDQWAWQKCSYQTSLQLPITLDNMDRVHSNAVSVQEFIRRWEAPCLPVVIGGLADAHMQKWQPALLLHRFANVKLKCGDDDDGRAVRIKMRHYRRYVQNEAKVDDSPLYVFDSAFGERAPAMLEDYEVPPYFREDLFQLVGRRRPPFRWIIIGPRFSGSGIHIDPLGTSAWNMLMCGHKRWVLFTPDVSADVVKPPRGMGREAVIWFAKMLPQLKREGVPCIDFIQKPGETIFVPSGWWHVILNLDFTVAVTQNFASAANFKHVWAATAKGRPRLASFWLGALEEQGHTALVAHAHELLQLWDPEGFERLPPQPSRASLADAGGAQVLSRRRDGLRDLMLDVRWKRRSRREERRLQRERDEWIASCWCWPTWACGAQEEKQHEDHWVCDDDHSTTSSDSSTSDEEDEQRQQQAQQQSEKQWERQASQGLAAAAADGGLSYGSVVDAQAAPAGGEGEHGGSLTVV